MNWDNFVDFELACKYCILDSFIDYEGYSISSKEFLPIIVDIMVIWVNLPIPNNFNSLIPKMSVFHLAISCFTTSNLPWFTDLTFHVPMHYCSLEHRTSLSPPNTCTGEHRFCFGAAIPFLLELLVITLCSSTVAYWTPSDLRGSSSSIPFCLFILSMGLSRQEYWSGAAISFFSGPCCVRTLSNDLTILGGPARHGSYLYWVT